jgi:hypothetical protein
MGRLYCSESGRTLGTLDERVGRRRWARKKLRLSAAAAAAAADLWIYASPEPGVNVPLRVEVNGQPAGELPVPRRRSGDFHWLSLSLPSTILRAGVNTIVFRCDVPGLGGWNLGLEGGHQQPASALSCDAGASWCSKRMGVHHVLAGEYIVRLYSHAASRPARIPVAAYEQPDSAAAQELLAAVPARIRRLRTPDRQLAALRSWVCTQWDYHGGQRYAPWEPLTILRQARHGCGHGGEPVVFCVHYSVVFVGLATALGHRARGVAISGNLCSHMGHFMAEVWDGRREQWVLHCATLDSGFVDDGRPLSLIDVAAAAQRGDDLAALVQSGPGLRPDQCGGSTAMLTDQRLWDLAGIWRRNDFLSHPQARPPAHGSVIYAETDFVWYTPEGRRTGGEQAPMFPLRTPHRAYFDAPS